MIDPPCWRCKREGKDEGNDIVVVSISFFQKEQKYKMNILSINRPINRRCLPITVRVNGGQ